MLMAGDICLTNEYSPDPTDQDVVREVFKVTKSAERYK